MPKLWDVYQFYESMPGPLRRVADLAYRFVPERMLRSREVNAIKAELHATERMSLEELQMQQLLRLKALLVHAGDTTAYYKRVFRESGFDAREMRRFDDIRVLPVLSKADIVPHYTDLRSSAYSGRECYPIRTSGSTGKYLEFEQSKVYFDRAAAHTERYQSWMGASNKSRRAFFYRAIMKHPVQSDTHPPYERFRNRVILSQFHNDESSLSYYVDLLNDFQPEFITIYPSTAIALTRYCATSDRVRFRPKGIQCYSENLPPEYRDEIEEYWKCKVFNRYGHGEGCVSAADCEYGNMHISVELGYTEFLRPDGTPARTGELARIVSTGLFTHAMPFIRYDTGDFGTLSERTCPCGRTLPLLEQLDGRGDSMVFAKDGKVVSQLGGIFVRINGIKMCQVVQEKKGELIIRVVPDAGYGPESEAAMLANLRRNAGDAFDVRIETVDDIERSPSGKVRLVISHLPKEEQYR